VDLFSSYISVDTLTSDALLAEALSVPLPPVGAVPASDEKSSQGDQWGETFALALKAQHTKIREFLDSRRERWQQIAIRFTEQIARLQTEIGALQAHNEELRAEAAAERETGKSGEVSSGRNMVPARHGDAAPDRGDWEAQKRRILAELESDDHTDKGSSKRRLEIEEIITRTDRIVAEKDGEIEELKHLLNNQSGSFGALALGAAALEQVFDQDEIIREERERLRLAEDELREKLRVAEIEHAMERARLARREMEIEERLRNLESHRPAAELAADALAPTGRPVRGRWRTQLGLTDDDPPACERGRR
jgi:hypothetical protein